MTACTASSPRRCPRRSPPDVLPAAPARCAGSVPPLCQQELTRCGRGPDGGSALPGAPPLRDAPRVARWLGDRRPSPGAVPGNRRHTRTAGSSGGSTPRASPGRRRRASPRTATVGRDRPRSACRRCSFAVSTARRSLRIRPGEWSSGSATAGWCTSPVGRTTSVCPNLRPSPRPAWKAFVPDAKPGRVVLAPLGEEVTPEPRVHLTVVGLRGTTRGHGSRGRRPECCDAAEPLRPFVELAEFVPRCTLRSCCSELGSRCSCRSASQLRPGLRLGRGGECGE